jgi:hypothetical protein
MYKYRVIIAHDDNTIYCSFGCGTKREAQTLALSYVDSAFVVVVVSEDCYKYSDNIIVARARKRTETHITEG